MITVTGLLAHAVSQEGVLFYTARSSFNTAEPGLPVQSFNSANMSAGNLLVESPQISSSTSDSIFSLGSILSNLTISAPTALEVVKGGPVPGASVYVGPEYFQTGLNLSFAQGVSAVGADVFILYPGHQNPADSFTATVYNGTTMLGSHTFSEAANSYAFAGVSSTTPITQVTLLYDGGFDAATFAANIAFGTSVPNLTIVPNGTNSVIILWPAPATNSYTLQQNSNLATTNWTTTGYAITNGFGTNFCTITPATGNLFFRLRHP
jgi:hypothetical protein